MGKRAVQFYLVNASYDFKKRLLTQHYQKFNEVTNYFTCREQLLVISLTASFRVFNAAFRSDDFMR